MTDLFDANLVLVQVTLVNFLLALSLLIPVRAGVFTFSGIGAYGIGTYATAATSLHWDWDATAAIASGIAVAGVACGALGLLVRRLNGLHLGMATIAFDLIVMVGIMNGGEFTGGTEGLFGVPATLPSWAVLLVVAGIVVLAAASERGRLGRRLEAVRLDPELSVTAGISVTRVRVAVFVVSAAIGAFAGGVNVTFRTIATPADMGFPVVVLTLTMIIVGGTGSWVGALVGAVFFTWLPSTLQFVGEWQEVVYGAIVAVVAIWVPGGVVGVLTEARHRRRSRRRQAALPGGATP